MDCSQIREAFLSGAVARSAEIEEHLRGCEQCRELFEHDAALGHTLARASASEVLLQDDLFSALEARLTQEVGLRAWLRSRPTRFRFAIVALSVIAVVVAGGLLRRRPDFAEYPGARLVLLLGIYWLGIGVAFGKELSLSARRGSLADYLGLLLGALGLPLLIAFAPATEVSRHAGPGGALNCFFYGALLTLPTAALLWAFDRDDLPSFRTVCLSAAALGLSANLVLELHCPSGNPLHLLLGHASIGLFWLATWFALRRLRRA